MPVTRKARRNDRIIFNVKTLMLFQDLSQITLRHRKALHPLLEILREKELRYMWHFPFALIVNHGGKKHVPRTPADLLDFCEAMNLDIINLLKWYQEFTLPLGEKSPPRSPFSSPEKRSSKKMKKNEGDTPTWEHPIRDQPPWGQKKMGKCVPLVFPNLTSLLQWMPVSSLAWWKNCLLPFCPQVQMKQPFVLLSTLAVELPIALVSETFTEPRSTAQRGCLTI